MKKLYRTQLDRKVSGVCGGIAHYFNIDPTLVRLLTVVLALVTAVFPFLLGYFIATFIIPNEQDVID
ncbi:PspC domain-containing protein [Bacillus sp. FJAT-45350]|uniref:PspC domain-containing protein n=1 Tax=Bacillus sp. FJAT-45350 TaxID=2011014 RepID=UPI000BB955C2|nr:PspC domain-containing protein [Bacillus sp. FJAT-45350]